MTEEQILNGLIGIVSGIVLVNLIPVLVLLYDEWRRTKRGWC